MQVLGWAVSRGPLMAPLNLPQFMAVAFMPISPVLLSANTTKKAGNARQGEVGQGAVASAVHFFIKLGILAVVLVGLQSPSPPRLLRELLYAVGLYLFIAIVMSCVGVFTVGFLGLAVAPHFDRPFLSSSLTDFWSRRWNLNTGYTMRFMIYDPICEGRLIKKEEGTTGPEAVSTWRRAAAVCASFAVSGWLHEVFIIYLRGRLSGYWMAFFTLQGPLLFIESMGRRWLKKRKILVPTFVAIPVALGVLLTLGDLFFFPDIVRMGIADQVVGNLYKILVPQNAAAAVSGHL